MTAVEETLPAPSPAKKTKITKIRNIDVFRDNVDDSATTVVIFIAFIFSYLLFVFCIKTYLYFR